jgi:hypothetical protein
LPSSNISIKDGADEARTFISVTARAVALPVPVHVVKAVTAVLYHLQAGELSTPVNILFGQLRFEDPYLSLQAMISGHIVSA